MHVNDIINEIRQFIKEEGITPYRLFVMAGITHRNSHLINSDNWNPTAATLAKLQDAIRVYRLGRE